MVALLIVAPATHRSSTNEIGSVILVGAAVLIPVAILMYRQVRTGRWSNVDASRPSERPILFAVALAGLVAGLGWLLLRDSHSPLVRGMLVVGGFLTLAALLTRWIKVSLHVAFAALAAAALAMLGSPVGYGLVLVVPALMWSRFTLSRHTVNELLIGLFLGVVSGVALILV